MLSKHSRKIIQFVLIMLSVCLLFMIITFAGEDGEAEIAEETTQTAEETGDETDVDETETDETEDNETEDNETGDEGNEGNEGNEDAGNETEPGDELSGEKETGEEDNSREEAGEGETSDETVAETGENENSESETAGSEAPEGETSEGEAAGNHSGESEATENGATKEETAQNAGEDALEDALQELGESSLPEEPPAEEDTGIFSPMPESYDEIYAAVLLFRRNPTQHPMPIWAEPIPMEWIPYAYVLKNDKAETGEEIWYLVEVR